jgi:hypothetical protein
MAVHGERSEIIEAAVGDCHGAMCVRYNCSQKFRRFFVLGEAAPIMVVCGKAGSS